MYLQEDEAARVVRSILRHTEILAGFAGLAHPEIDNSRLEHSAVRAHDRSFIHNLDRMIVQAGGTITGEHGVGLEKIKYMERIFDRDTLEAMCSVRRVFDPLGIANPGKVLPASTGCERPL